jgi:membrane protein
MGVTNFIARARTWYQRVSRALRNAYRDFDRNNYLMYAGALSFFFWLAFFPLLIFLSSLLAYIPVPNLFGQILDFMAELVPADAMGAVRNVLKDVLHTNPELMSFSILGAIFAASSGFSSLITVLNVAYDVHEARPYWKKELVAVGLTLLTGVMTVIALVSMVLGPRFGSWIADHTYMGPAFARLWPYMRWGAVAIFTVLAIEAIYFLAPNLKQKFTAQIPGAFLAVATWIGASWGLELYLRHFAHYNHTFGALGAVAALMLWLYVTALAIIVGAEINAELMRAAGRSLAERKDSQPLPPKVGQRDRLRKSA